MSADRPETYAIVASDLLRIFRGRCPICGGAASSHPEAFAHHVVNAHGPWQLLKTIADLLGVLDEAYGEDPDMDVWFQHPELHLRERATARLDETTGADKPLTERFGDLSERPSIYRRADAPLPVNACLLHHPHEPHDWWYTAWGGGHMLHGEPTEEDYRTEKGLKQHHCPGCICPEGLSRKLYIAGCPSHDDRVEVASNERGQIRRTSRPAGWRATADANTVDSTDELMRRSCARCGASPGVWCCWINGDGALGDELVHAERGPGFCGSCAARLAYVGATSCSSCGRSDADE
jgi:hypothetical protein